ncbi:hypothetical protein, partial [Burkholderia multivorans]|uniref:hypothetical protein n=1 Tax=Burkholderia multivorans TaxID=87883 RepID=UPI001C65CFF9
RSYNGSPSIGKASRAMSAKGVMRAIVPAARSARQIQMRGKPTDTARKNRGLHRNRFSSAESVALVPVSLT